MKLFISFMMTILLSTSIYAQKDVTTFLGIPVDGNKTEMRNKLIAKGFTPNPQLDNIALEGEFNGVDVNIAIATNNNKVYRIALVDANPRDEINIKNRFNKLVSQFNRNERYVFLEDQEIPESEDISYEMTVNKKVYEAIFYQKPQQEMLDSIPIIALQELSKRYTMEQLRNSTKEIEDAKKNEIDSVFKSLLSKKPVWFRINQVFEKYQIIMFYDNEYNHANGEDL